ncbi:unnamed protein product [Victoria cruziana]
MDPDAFSATLFKWDARAAPPSRLLIHDAPLSAAAHVSAGGAPALGPAAAAAIPPPYCRSKELGGLEDLFQNYGVRYFTLAKMAEMGFTASTLLNMKDEELDEMMTTLVDVFHWDLLVGERFGIKAAVRAERRWLLDDDVSRRRHHLASADSTNPLDALSQEGLSEEPVQGEKVGGVAGNGGGGGGWDVVVEGKKGQRRRRGSRGGINGEGGGDDGGDRQREHPFIVTEPGEVARGKKNGLDYLFHLYEECRGFLIQVQNIAKERGEKCPTKVTNQVFRYAKSMGASYINKPKMRHYVHCYALHCLDEAASNRLRRAFKERGENVGAWRQACYQPLVAMAAHHSWDIDAIFNANEKLCIWYVPTKLRQLCHQQRTAAAASMNAAHLRQM